MKLDVSEPRTDSAEGTGSPGAARSEVRRAAGRFATIVLASLGLLGLLAATPALRTVGAIVIVLVNVPLLVVTWLDLAHALRGLPTHSRITRAAAFFATIPEALLGAVSISFGLAILGWVLYNELVERQPQYRGSFPSFGIAPLLIGVGAVWLRRAFREKD